MDQSEIRILVADLAATLGRTPTRAEAEKHIPALHYNLKKLNINYSQVLLAIGLDTYDDRRKKKIDNSIFMVDLERHLDRYKPTEYKPPAKYPNIMSISDIHWPFSSKRVLDAFIEKAKRVVPDYVIVNGDAWDMYSHSKYPRSHNIFTPRQEQEIARNGNEEFWAEIKKISADIKCYQMMGNHDVRPLKRIMEVYPEAEDWIEEKIKQLFSFNGVTTIHDAREELMIQDIAVFHGYRGKLGDHRDYTLLNCMNGHTHRGGVSFRQIHGRVIWELNSGVAGDPESKGLTYVPQKIIHWTPGFSAVLDSVPMFIPA